uniref:Retrovirus-related Pol polyprotein from transposon 17.6 n=1 Tax=Vitis vinifera TaxID=29760 RepID=A5BMR3_VITVI|nr:hypothetical protein VITISV_035490 [Vitis vinifera]
MMHRDVEVYVDYMIMKSRDKLDHLVALERFFKRIRQFRLRLNPKKCTFRVTSRKLLGYMVSDRGIKADPDKIRAILDMLVPRTKRDIKRFLGRLQYISRFIARLSDICELIFQLLRKSQPTIWDDQCQREFERIREYLLSPPVLVPPTPSRPLLLYLSVLDVALGCMLAQLDDSGKDRAIYYLSKSMLDYEMRYVMIEHYCLTLVWATRRLRHYMTKWSIVADHLASLPVSDGRAIDDDFPDKDVAVVTSLSSWRMYFDGTANHSRYGIGLETTVKLGIRQMEVFGDSNLVLRQIQDEWKTRDMKLRPYHAYLELLVQRFDDLRYTHLPKALNQFADALATLASMIDIHVEVWGISIIGKISPKSSSGHEFILVVINYFTKWVEAASYARLTSSGTNEAVEATNKNIKRILWRVVETSQDWSTKLLFVLWAYQTSFCTSIGATPYSLVYGMKILETDWAQARLNQLNLLDERRLRAANHVRTYQRKMTSAFKKRVKPKPLQRGDLVLKVIRGLIRDPRGKFKPNWSGPYFIWELTPKGAAWLIDLDRNEFSKPTNVDQLKRHYV